MGAVLIPLIAILVVVVLLGLLAKAWTARRTARNDDLARTETVTLDYVVPTGQDPTLILAALSSEGYDAAPDPGQTQLVHIACPAGQERVRAHVRATIAGVHRTGVDDTEAHFDPGTVRFVDET
jgi:hypothetical protein